MVLERPSRDSLLMDTATLWSRRSTCSRAKVGCVVSRKGRILVQGYNGAPANLIHCSHQCICGYSDPVYQPPEAHLSNCPFPKPCIIAVHAEANAIAYAAKVGVSLEDTEMYTTLVPCRACSMLIINTGITRVVYKQDYRDMSGLVILSQAFVEVVQYDKIAS